MKLALLGAQRTGKTRLAGELAAGLREQGKSVAVVGDALREWCQREGRPPIASEQLAIAREQERRVDSAIHGNDVVIADTTALMVAIDGGMLFEDGELYRFALERQRRYDITLLTGLDLPWVADGPLRAGSHARAKVDALVREALNAAGVAYRVVYGQGLERADNAMAGVAASPDRSLARSGAGPSKRWQWVCDKCSDPQCEDRLFTRATRPAPT